MTCHVHRGDSRPREGGGKPGSHSHQVGRRTEPSAPNQSGTKHPQTTGDGRNQSNKQEGHQGPKEKPSESLKVAQVLGKAPWGQRSQPSRCSFSAQGTFLGHNLPDPSCPSPSPLPATCNMGPTLALPAASSQMPTPSHSPGTGGLAASQKRGAIVRELPGRPLAQDGAERGCLPRPPTASSLRAAGRREWRCPETLRSPEGTTQPHPSGRPAWPKASAQPLETHFLPAALLPGAIRWPRPVLSQVAPGRAWTGPTYSQDRGESKCGSGFLAAPKESP